MTNEDDKVVMDGENNVVRVSPTKRKADWAKRDKAKSTAVTPVADGEAAEARASTKGKKKRDADDFAADVAANKKAADEGKAPSKLFPLGGKGLRKKADIKAEKDAAKAAAKGTTTAKPAKVKVEKDPNAFTVRDWAADNKVDPRKARAHARKHRPELVKLEASKHTFPNTNRAKVDAIMKAMLTA